MPKDLYLHVDSVVIPKAKKNIMILLNVVRRIVYGLNCYICHSSTKHRAIEKKFIHTLLTVNKMISYNVKFINFILK